MVIGVALIVIAVCWIVQRVFIAAYYTKSVMGYPTDADAEYIIEMNLINNIGGKQLRTKKPTRYQYIVQGNEYSLSIAPGEEPMLFIEVLYGDDPADAFVKDILVSPILIIIALLTGSMAVYITWSFR